MRSLLSKIVYFPLRTYVVVRNHIRTRLCKKIDYRDIPIYINNRNRVTFLNQVIDSLREKGYRKLIVIDNNSSYPPCWSITKAFPAG
jgi:protoheme ferro-lyase